MKQISLNSIRVILEVCVIKNPTCFSRWSVRIQCSLQNITQKQTHGHEEDSLNFECDNDHTAPCRRRPVDHANLESWTFEEATESGFPCWIKEWVDSVGIQEGLRCEEGLHVKIPVQIYYDEGPVIGGM